MALLPEVQQYQNEKAVPARKRFAIQLFRLAAFVGAASILGAVLSPGIAAVWPKVWSGIETVPDLVRALGMAVDQQWRAWAWQVWLGAGVLLAIWVRLLSIEIAPVVQFHQTNFRVSQQSSQLWLDEKLVALRTVLSYWSSFGAVGAVSFVLRPLTGISYCICAITFLVLGLGISWLFVEAAVDAFSTINKVDLKVKSPRRASFIK